MAATLLSNVEYNSIPTLQEAAAAVKSFQVTQDMMLFGDIFLKHLMHDTWGLSLVHRHFDLKPNEIMLEQPVNRDAKTVTKAVEVSKVVAPLTGSNYRFQEDGKLLAFEYRYHSDATLQEVLQNERFLAFLCDLKQTIAETGLDNVLGLTPVESTKPGLETTNYENRENIVEPLADGTPMLSDYVTAVWAFNESGPGVQRGCRWVTMCQLWTDSNGNPRHTSGAHMS
ncbi:hypothetical protein BC936DRAFT_142998 [Jimgerdemannia flammicorona]|uniref:Uncharacterized protein n=1 Tax=Jimgerdemannia flammicorona TaxID=994334 RepID=A0A433DMJ6_9FUNG|nr:hypothetical protein BC936DRAFT_142998 [Jimgerdemannia flammicorona]